jgi:peptide/nickel transport system substrate-binding protein
MRTTRILAAVAAASLLAVACGGDDDGGDGGSAASTTTPADPTSITCEQGTEQLEVTTLSQPRGIDPIFAAGGSTIGIEMAAIYDTLVRWDSATGDFEPWVAESLEGDGTGTEWTLTLREGVTFGNGDPLTTAAVQASIERHQDPANASLNSNMANTIERFDIVDDRTMTFVLDGPWGGFPFALTTSVGMITNPAVVAERGEGFAADPGGAGVGPFDFVHFRPGEELLLEARDDYWAGTPCVPGVRFVHIVGSRAAYEALQQGEIDVAFLREPVVVDEARADGVGLHSWPFGLGEILMINNGARGTTPPTADVRVRQAIAAALDPVQIDLRANDGTGNPTSAIFGPGSRFDDAGDGPAHDPALARRLVDEVKAEGAWDGTVRLLCDNAPARQELALAAQAQLQAAGFEVQLDGGKTITDIIGQVIGQADYDLACWGYNVGDAEPWSKLAKNLQGGSSANFAGFADAEFDAALAELRAAATFDAQAAAIAELQARWDEVVPVAGLATVEESIAWADDVDGLIFTTEAVALLGRTSVGG